VASSDSQCGSSQDDCVACGGASTWCSSADTIASDEALKVSSDTAEGSSPAVGVPSTSAICSAIGEDCSTSKCCADAGFQCFRKNEWWASCKTTCVPGVDSADPEDARTPWECAVLGGSLADAGADAPTAKDAKEIVIMLRETPLGLIEGAEVSIELGAAESASESPPSHHAEASGEGWTTPFLAFEGAAASMALLIAGYYYVESRRTGQALEAVHAAGKASPSGLPRSSERPHVPRSTPPRMGPFGQV